MDCFSFHTNMLYSGINITFYWDCRKWRSRHRSYISTLLSQALNLVQIFKLSFLFKLYVSVCITFYSSSVTVLGEVNSRFYYHSWVTSSKTQCKILNSVNTWMLFSYLSWTNIGCRWTSESHTIVSTSLLHMMALRCMTLCHTTIRYL